MFDQPRLVRFVVVRRDLERRVRARLFGVLGQVERLARGIRAGTRDDFDPFARRLDGNLDDFLVLLVIERRRLAGRPHRNDAVDPVLDLHLDQLAEFSKIHIAAFIERRDNCGIGALEHNSRPFHFSNDWKLRALFFQGLEKMQ